MGVYDINYETLVVMELPVRRRKPVWIHWLMVLVSPVVYLYNLFLLFRTNKLYELGHTGQVCYLEGALNDMFDSLLRGIYISDPPYCDPLWLPLDSEVPPYEPVWTALDSEADPEWLPLDSEVDSDSSIFIVNVPHYVFVSVGYSEAQLRALVNKYRIPSKMGWILRVLP